MAECRDSGCNFDARLAGIEATVQGFKTVLSRQTDLLERLVRLEERQAEQSRRLSDLAQVVAENGRGVASAAPALAIGRWAAGIAAGVATTGVIGWIGWTLSAGGVK